MHRLAGSSKRQSWLPPAARAAAEPLSCHHPPRPQGSPLADPTANADFKPETADYYTGKVGGAELRVHRCRPHCAGRAAGARWAGRLRDRRRAAPCPAPGSSTPPRPPQVIPVAGPALIGPIGTALTFVCYLIW